MLHVPISQNYLSRLNLMVLNPIFKWIKGLNDSQTRDRKKKKKKGYSRLFFEREQRFPNVSRLITTINRSFDITSRLYIRVITFVTRYI